MTKEITKAYLLQELQDKFGLREFTPANFLFEETVIPTYNVEPHLRQQMIEISTVSITSTGGFEFYTVPADENWTLNVYTVVFMGAGAIKVGGVYVQRRAGGSDFCYLDLIKNQSVSYTHLMPYPFLLEHGDGLWVFVDEYTSIQNLRLQIDYSLEKIR